MSNLIVSKDMEIRHLSVNHRLQLVNILDVDESVLNLLMGNISKNGSELRFNSADIDAIREHAQKLKQSAIQILLDEWGTMGRNRPKMKDLLDLLVKCQLFKAADFLADLIQEDKPVRPMNGPAASVDISLENEDLEDIINRLSYPFSSIEVSATNANRMNFIKPDLNSPNLNDLMNNNNGVSSQTNQSKIFNQPLPERSDLIKFSKSSINQAAVTEEKKDETNDYLPAISALMLNSNRPVETITNTQDQLPIFLLSAEQKSSIIPDISALMNQSNGDASSYISQSEDQSESFTNTSS